MDKTVILGMFDGVHIGHAALFDIAKSIRSEKKCVFTFKNHPAEFITGRKIPLLLTEKERMTKLRAMGADEIIAADFDESLCATSPENFALMLKKRFGAKDVVAGFNYTFGAKGAGNANDLISFGRKFGFDVHIADPVTYGDEPVSSSRIRAAIRIGDIESANAMLGDSFSVSGIVEKGRQVGRKMGFPTANIRNSQGKALPLLGVYVTQTHLGKRVLESITNVGTNPTFGAMDVSIETHIKDFDEDIYGREIKVEFLHFVRGQRVFASMDELKEQIGKDLEAIGIRH